MRNALHRIFAAHLIISLATISMWVTRADAQGVDPNIQEFIQPFRPGSTNTSDDPEQQEVVITPARVVQTTRKRSEAERQTELQTAIEKRGVPEVQLYSATPQDLQSLFKKYGIAATETKQIYIPAVKALVPKPRSVTVNLQASSTGSYESNANKRPSNTTGDEIASFAPGVVVVIPIGPKEDSITLSSGVAMVRYHELTGSSSDTASSSLVYSTLLSKTAGQHTLKAGLNGDAVFEEQFDDYQVGFLSGSLRYIWSKIPVGKILCIGPGSTHCADPTITLRLTQVWSDIDSQENQSATLSPKLSWTTPFKDFSVSLGGSIRARHFTHVAGGRDDMIYGVSADFSQKVSPSVSLTGGVGYTEQTSTLEPVEWDGLAVKLGLEVDLAVYK